MSVASVKSGFYDAVYTTVGGVLTPDRAYNSSDLGGLFDGFIGDGVFSSVGDAFSCTPGTNALDLVCGTGRAWFNGHWIANTVAATITFDAADIDLPRRDALVLDLDWSDNVRAADIKIVKGTATSVTPLPDPTLINTSTHKQYLICVVDFPIRSAFGSIGDANCPITYRIGTNASTPFVTNILNYIDPTLYTTQLQTDFTAFITAKNTDYTTWKTSWNTDITAWYLSIKDLIDSTTQAQLQHMFRDYYEVTLASANWTTISGNKYKYDIDVTSQGYTSNSVVDFDLNTVSTDNNNAESYKVEYAYIYATEFNSDYTHIYVYAYDIPTLGIPVIIRGK